MALAGIATGISQPILRLIVGVEQALRRYLAAQCERNQQSEKQ